MKTFKQYLENVYQIDHKPMNIDSGAAPLHDLTKSFPEDIYSKNALHLYGSGDDREKSVLKIMNSVRNKPDSKVTIYRGVPSHVNEINPGDWVTLHKDVANDYTFDNHGNKVGKVLSKIVPAKHVTSWADSLLEFGYHPK